MHFRIDMKIIALEPQANGLTLLEGRATDGTDVAVTVRVVEPLAVGDWMTVALITEPSAAPALSMRERMQARARGAAPTNAAPRSAMSSAAAPTTSAAGDASSLLLSSILGSRADPPKTSELSDIFNNAPLVERNVDDEMDALFGAPPRKG